jgi:hypothetical protein
VRAGQQFEPGWVCWSMGHSGTAGHAGGLGVSRGGQIGSAPPGRHHRTSITGPDQQGQSGRWGRTGSMIGPPTGRGDENASSPSWTRRQDRPNGPLFGAIRPLFGAKDVCRLHFVLRQPLNRDEVLLEHRVGRGLHLDSRSKTLYPALLPPKAAT